MKQIALLAVTLALVSSAAAAQEQTKAAKSKAAAKPAAAADAKPKWTEHLAEHFTGLTLTADQKDRIAAANKKHHDAMDKIKVTEKDEAVRKTQIKGHQDAEHADFQGILTAEQYAVFEKNMAKMEEHMKMEGKTKKPGAMDHDKMDMKEHHKSEMKEHDKMDKKEHDKMDKKEHDKMDKKEHDKMDKAATKPVKKP